MTKKRESPLDNKRVVQVLWKKGVRDSARVQCILRELGCKELKDDYLHVLLRRLRDTGSVGRPNRPIPKNLDEKLARIERLLDERGLLND